MRSQRRLIERISHGRQPIIRRGRHQSRANTSRGPGTIGLVVVASTRRLKYSGRIMASMSRSLEMGVVAMRGPKPPVGELFPEVRQELEGLLRRHSLPQQLALRARIILAAADGANNSQIARLLDLDVDTVRRWRSRWLAFAPIPLSEFSLHERLSDVPAPDDPSKSVPSNAAT